MCFRCLENSLSESISRSDGEILFRTMSSTTEKAQSFEFCSCSYNGGSHDGRWGRCWNVLDHRDMWNSTGVVYCAFKWWSWTRILRRHYTKSVVTVFSKLEWWEICDPNQKQDSLYCRHSYWSGLSYSRWQIMQLLCCGSFSFSSLWYRNVCGSEQNLNGVSACL